MEAKNLIVDTGKLLLDREMDAPVVAEIREVVEADAGDSGTRIVDLHVWRIGRQSYACALAVVTRDPSLTANTLRERLAGHEEIVHSTIEVHYRGWPRYRNASTNAANAGEVCRRFG